jgi:ABC-type transport system involved in multi-copper enzyme maturation permease subunit
MMAVLPNFVARFLSFSWLTGPIFDKELRVSSRRRRNYCLRFVYLVLLTGFVVMVWLSTVRLPTAAATAFQTSRMSLAGILVIGAIVWFQFITTQLIAVIMLSTAISDEIYNKTLGVLMTTPINSFQIVMGKLFSKLLQLILLLAITLPLLAVVRVFGGVPWDYVISSLCMTLAAVIFAGSLSLNFSISSRRAYVVILKTVFTLGFLYVFIPAMTGLLLRTWLLSGPRPGAWLMTFVSVFFHTNPFAALWYNSVMMMSPRMGAVMPFFRWPVHCAVMLGASALVLARTVRVVRKVALRQATGQLDPFSKRRKRRKQIKSSVRTAGRDESTGPIRRVTGSPVIWKELRAPMIQGAGGKSYSIIGLVLTIIALLITYAVCIREKCLDEDFTHISYTLLFVIMGLIVNMVLAATTITSEKETRCWPLLLATSLDDWHILLGKAVGVVRRCLPIWLLLAGHVALFVSVRYIHPAAIPNLAILVTSVMFFLSGSGLYFSARLKRTTSAVVANFTLAIVLWAIIPALLGLVTQITQEPNWAHALERYVSANPVFQASVIMRGTGGDYNARRTFTHLNYYWPGGRWRRPWATTAFLMSTMLLYMFIGFLFAWRAKCRFRRNIF